MEFAHSTQEFVLRQGWLNGFFDAYSARGVRLFSKSPTTPLSGANTMGALLKVTGSFNESLFEKELRRPLSMTPQGLLSAFESANALIGRELKGRWGYRDRPLVVMSSAHPWATFFSPYFDAKSELEMQISHLLDFERRKKTKVDFFIAALILSMIVVHPFVDGNGRSARLVAYALLRRLLRLRDQDAFAYASKFSGESPFVFATWDIREKTDYKAYIALLE